MILELLIYITLFIVYLIPQAMFINGVYLSGVGFTEVMPDGTEKDGEMILYPLKKYLMQHKVKKVYYSGKFLIELLEKINNHFPLLEKRILLTGEEEMLWRKLLFQVEQKLEIKIEFNGPGEIRFYKEYQQYRFSKYLRKPILGCIVCMSSFWGIFTFLLPAYLIFRDPIVFALYVPNSFCLAYLNFKIHKPL